MYIQFKAGGKFKVKTITESSVILVSQKTYEEREMNRESFDSALQRG